MSRLGSVTNFNIICHMIYIKYFYITRYKKKQYHISKSIFYSVKIRTVLTIAGGSMKKKILNYT